MGRFEHPPIRQMSLVTIGTDLPDRLAVLDTASELSVGGAIQAVVRESVHAGIIHLRRARYDLAVSEIADIGLGTIVACAVGCVRRREEGTKLFDRELVRLGSRLH